MDTQWPRWEVFKQDSPKKPHQAVGSVHAADPEHALLTARNVFVRRPKAISLWVAPESAIFARTAEELATGSNPFTPDPQTDTPQTFLVFRKDSHRRSMTFVDHIGEVTAVNATAALDQALAQFGADGALVWWLVPAAAILASDPDDAPSWFEPAADKTYRNQSAYGTISARPQSSDDE